MMKFQASHKYARISPRKVRYVIDLIRGKAVNDALTILKHTAKRAAPMVAKVLKSAIANAGQQGVSNVNELYVAECRSDGGPMLKRFRPGPMGRAMRIRKRTAHINIAVAEKVASVDVKQEDQE